MIDNLLNLKGRPVMIDSYSFGNITIDNKKFNIDLIIYPDHINPS